ncbi:MULTISPECIES: hypothetical protein [Luteimonas]|uniref:Uncharacterized protein n=1 Tax=Luteimonas chenhongjianii TaxID=2006110 RepID=A0A290XHB5_9GAMM|nr:MULTISPECIES: hypothetical protein [Luteimonas]ATD68517.1 hypothetical protein CNR27_14630 [Luteimonas chenhongjianii]RPD87799.1 hypothetical protein EGK76_00955 [Luteimonas sp. 100069]
MTWDALQSAALDALGHVRYRVEVAASVWPNDPLVDALLRAAGLDRDSQSAQALLSSLGPLDGLRSASAKRALWPRLRRFRRHGG